MQESVVDILIQYAAENGLEVRLVPWAEAQKDKAASRRRDQEDIAAGRATAKQVTMRNSGGMADVRMVIDDKSGSYLLT